MDKNTPKNEVNSLDEKPKIFKKPSSPFNNDIYNNRGGKGGKKSGFSDVSKIKMKSANVKKFKGGSGGDR